MTFTLEESPSETAVDAIVDAPPAMTTDRIQRGGRTGRAALILVLGGFVAALGGIAVVVSADEVGTADPGAGDERTHGHVADGAEHAADHAAQHATYEAQSAAVEPPLPRVAPAGTFDPAVSITNQDASITVAVVEGWLVYTEPSGPINARWVEVPPGFEPRALSLDGRLAALVSHNVDGDGRVQSTDVAVARRPINPADAPTLTLHHLSGLIEPEAFSTDGGELFVIDHQAGSEPGTYRVRPLDVETGELKEMLGPTKEPLIEDMNGTGRRQIWGLNDSRLYTLYIRQTGHVHASGNPGSEGFIHILDLDEEWAFCLDLPSTFGKGDLTTTVMAVGAGRLAVLDLTAGEAGQLAYASTTDRTVTDVIDLPLSFRRTMKALLVSASEQSGRPAGWQPTVHLALDRTVGGGTALAVGVGDALAWFDGRTLEPLGADGDPAGEGSEGHVDLAGPLFGLTSLPGRGVLAWTEGGQGPEQLSPPHSME